MDGPLLIGELLEAVELEVEKLPDAHPRLSQEEEGLGLEASHRLELPPNRLVALLGKRLGEAKCFYDFVK